jgi:large-conductance mechanosensitive channel
MMPPLGLAMGAVDFKEQYVPLAIREQAATAYEKLLEELNPEWGKAVEANKEHAKKGEPAEKVPDRTVSPTLDQMAAKGIPTLRYGVFLNTIINFLFVAFGVFLIVKLMATLQRQPPPKPAAPPEPTATEKLLAEIRDALKAQRAR